MSGSESVEPAPRALDPEASVIRERIIGYDTEIVGNGHGRLSEQLEAGLATWYRDPAGAIGPDACYIYCPQGAHGPILWIGPSGDDRFDVYVYQKDAAKDLSISDQPLLFEDAVRFAEVYSRELVPLG